MVLIQRVISHWDVLHVHFGVFFVPYTSAPLLTFRARCEAPKGEDWWKGGSRSGQSLSWSVQTQKTWPLASAIQRRCLRGRTWRERKEKVAVYMGTWRRWSRSSGFTYGKCSLMSDGLDKTCRGGRGRGKDKKNPSRSRSTFTLRPKGAQLQAEKQAAVPLRTMLRVVRGDAVAPWPVWYESFKSVICRKRGKNTKWKQEWDEARKE